MKRKIAAGMLLPVILLVLCSIFSGASGNGSTPRLAPLNPDFLKFMENLKENNPHSVPGFPDLPYTTGSSPPPMDL